MPECYIVLIKPSLSISTKTVFENFSLSECEYHPDTDGIISALKSKDLHALSIRAFNVLEKAVEPRTIKRDRWTVAQKIVAIQDALVYKPKVRFTELFDSDYSRSEVINVFLALLELLKMQKIRVQQGEIYDEIDIVAREEETNVNG